MSSKICIFNNVINGVILHYDNKYSISIRTVIEHSTRGDEFIPLSLTDNRYINFYGTTDTSSTTTRELSWGLMAVHFFVLSSSALKALNIK